VLWTDNFCIFYICYNTSGWQTLNFTSQSWCSCCRWQVPIHHEVVLLIITLDSKFLARRWKLRPAATPRNARWNPAVGVVMKSETFFIFCFCGGSGAVLILPHPALFLMFYSFCPTFPPSSDYAVWTLYWYHQRFYFLDLVIAKPVASTRISRSLQINICWDRRQIVCKWMLCLVVSSLDGCMNYMQ